MITIHSKDGCKNCELIKIMFTKYEIKFTYIVHKSFQNLAKYLEKTDFEDLIFEYNSFPIVTNDAKQWIGGYKEILEEYEEPLLRCNPTVYSFYPIMYPDIYELYKKSRASYWQPEEISLVKDLKDWETLNENEKYFIEHVLAFFSASDGIVNENIDTNFSKDIQIQEARACYAFQQAIEAVHSETYSILLDKYVTDLKKKQKLQNAIYTIHSIKNKANWCLKYMNKELSFHRRLLAFCFVEGVYFSGSFCAIFWLKKRGLMPGLSFSNELISRDEGLHTEFSIMLYNKLKHRINQHDVHELVDEAVNNEKEFINNAIPCNLIGMNANLMSNYIEFVADKLLNKLGYDKLYFKENPFDFMENISLEGKTNFFERKVGEYAKANVMNNDGNDSFALDEDF
jgi:ribonucleotide reductase beta subunit family protein with ferritin-like domain